MNNATTMDAGRAERLTAAASWGAGGFASSLLGALVPSKRHSTDRLTGATNRGPIGDRGRFWILQLTFWPLYGMILMVPWVGVFTFSSMLPNKLIVAGTGILAGLALRAALRLVDRAGFRGGVALALPVVVVVVGLAWDAGLSLLVGQSVHIDLQRLGSASGVPTLAGGLYHVVILALWAMAWRLVRENVTTREQVTTPGSEGIVFRDGRATHVFRPDEIEWVRADGDYVVVSAGKRRLMVRATLSGTEAKLPSPDYLRIHRSHIVRVRSVRELHPRSNKELDVVLRDGTRLRASRRYSERLLSAIDPTQVCSPSAFITASESPPDGRSR
jgi:hypothetical protein